MKIIYTCSLLVALLLSATGCGPDKSPNTPKSNNGTAARAAQTSRISFSELAVVPKPELTPQLVEHGKTIYGQNCAACHTGYKDGENRSRRNPQLHARHDHAARG